MIWKSLTVNPPFARFVPWVLYTLIKNETWIVMRFESFPSRFISFTTPFHASIVNFFLFSSQEKIENLSKSILNWTSARQSTVYSRLWCVLGQGRWKRKSNWFANYRGQDSRRLSISGSLITLIVNAFIQLPNIHPHSRPHFCLLCNSFLFFCLLLLWFTDNRNETSFTALCVFLLLLCHIIIQAIQGIPLYAVRHEDNANTKTT